MGFKTSTTGFCFKKCHRSTNRDKKKTRTRFACGSSFGPPGGIRTPGLWNRNPLRYPASPRADIYASLGGVYYSTSFARRLQALSDVFRKILKRTVCSIGTPFLPVGKGCGAGARELPYSKACRILVQRLQITFSIPIEVSRQHTFSVILSTLKSSDVQTTPCGNSPFQTEATAFHHHSIMPR